MKLKYYLKDNLKIYTFKEKDPQGNPTKSAHYKFIKLKDIKTI